MRKTKSPILDAVHETAVGLFKAGVMDQVTLREFDRDGVSRNEHAVKIFEVGGHASLLAASQPIEQNQIS